MKNENIECVSIVRTPAPAPARRNEEITGRNLTKQQIEEIAQQIKETYPNK
jgi:hypothetical protein